MNPFEMVVIIVLIGCATGAFRAWIRAKEKAGGAHTTGQEQRIATLEDRVKALEAVVTDHGYDLKKQFRELEKS